MYKKGDIIVYNNKGVYKIEDIGIPDIDWLKDKKEYYTLKPLFNDSIIRVPTDTNVFMRKTMSKEEALQVIDRFPGINIDECEYKNQKTLENYYRRLFETNDIIEIAKIIKCVYLKTHKDGKKKRSVALVDEQYMRMAENVLYEELAVALQIDREEVFDFIEKRIEGK